MENPAQSRRLMQRVRRRLVAEYGPRPWSRSGTAVDELVATILSQNTSDANSSAGYRRLRKRFPSWSAVAEAPEGEVRRAIAVSGLSRLKAPRIQSILRQVRRERGRISLEFLGRMEPGQAYRYLTGFEGVGPKTANCVLLFSFGMAVFPVDTHIHRIARRLGVLAEGASADEAHERLLPLIAPADRYAMHLLLIAHGREVCRARSPRCRECFLLGLCPWGQRREETKA